MLERQDSEIEQFDYSWSHFWTTPRRVGRCHATPDAAAVLDHVPRRAQARQIISENIGESAMYGGAIASRGPRYCPSVEDKIVKFPAAERHQLFLEPEGHDTSELYVNGLSTSLPAPVQLEMLRIGARTRERANDARRIRDRVRLLSADAARRDAAGEGAARAVFRRTDQRHDRLRGSGGPGRRRRARTPRARALGSAPSFSAARLRTSACSSTIS